MYDETQEILDQARVKAVEAKNEYLAGWLDRNPDNRYGEPVMCGFAWVDVKTRSNSKLGKLLQENGFRKSYRSGVLTLWDPSNHHGQSVDVKVKGAIAYAQHLTDNGIPCEWGSRFD